MRGRLSYPIILEVAKKHRIKIEELRGRSRVKQLVSARTEACYRLRTETSLSYPQIATTVGLTDHTSARTAVIRYAERHGLTVPEGCNPILQLSLAGFMRNNHAIGAY